MGIVNLLSTGNYGETQRFQRLVFLTYSAFLYFAWNRNPHNSQNMGKLNSHSKGKLWENAIGFLRISCEVLIYAMPKTWKKWIHVVKKEYGKRKRFKVKGFLDFSLEAEIHAIPKIWEKWVSIVQEKYGKTQHCNFMGFVNISGEAEIHAILKTWQKWIPIIQEKYGKKQTFQS